MKHFVYVEKVGDSNDQSIDTRLPFKFLRITDVQINMGFIKISTHFECA